MRAIFAALFCLFIAGCAGGPPKIETQIVKVPVYQTRPCAPTVCHEFKPSGPLPVFTPDLNDPKNAVLTPAEQTKLRILISDLKSWGQALLQQARP